MDQLTVRGGTALRGTVRASGSKNATLALMAATLLSEKPSVLRNVPRVRDVETMIEILAALGLRVSWHTEEPHTLCFAGGAIRSPEAPYELVRQMRASFLVLGPLLVRCGVSRVSEPGGCAIGVRPVDQHLRGLAALGAAVRLDHGVVEASAYRLEGGTVRFDLSTVNGTQNVMMAAVLTRGETTIENAAREPEVVELAEALCQMGAEIRGAGTDRLWIRGTTQLDGLDRTVWGDRIEAGTLLAAGWITGGSVTVSHIAPHLLEAITEKLREAGAEVEASSEGVSLRSAGRPQGLRVVTAPHPGFPTDMQAQLLAVTTLAAGSSIITETVFENRFMHVPELQRMGADIDVDGRSAHVRGVDSLSAAPVMATDLRASASLVLAGLAAEGETTVHRVYHIDRGYERIDEKLRSLGAEIRREG